MSHTRPATRTALTTYVTCCVFINKQASCFYYSNIEVHPCGKVRPHPLAGLLRGLVPPPQPDLQRRFSSLHLVREGHGHVALKGSLSREHLPLGEGSMYGCIEFDQTRKYAVICMYRN